jgi:rSAM/selenodomain-associated transferase 1
LTDRALGVFAKAPLSGRVKTRLAAEIGAAPADALYGRMAHAIVARTVGSSYRTVVWYAPASAEFVVRRWLRGLGVRSFRPQRGRGLGARLEHAFDRLFRGGGRSVVIIGTDCPALRERDLLRAFEALESHDVVLGPARDGGYYLVGLRRRQPGLFRRIPWSTAEVMRVTLERASHLGLSCKVLRPMRDVDRASDARAFGLVR